MPKILKSFTSPSFENSLDKLEKKIQETAMRKIAVFENNFLHPSLRAHKLHGELSRFWAFSVTKSYRILFKFLKDNEVVYCDIGDHDMYKS